MRVGNKLFSVEIDPLVFATASEEQLRQLRRNFPCFRLKKTEENKVKKPFEISEELLSKSGSFRNLAEQLGLSTKTSTELVDMLTKKKDAYTGWFRGMVRQVLGERLAYEESLCEVEDTEGIVKAKKELASRLKQMVDLAARTALSLNELEFPSLDSRLRQAGIAVLHSQSDSDRRKQMVSVLTLVELRKGQFKDLLSPGDE